MVNRMSDPSDHSLPAGEVCQQSDDRVQPVSQQSQLHCPLCPTLLVGAKLDGAAVLYCDDCRGVLVPSDVFSQVVANRRVAFQGPETAPTPLDVRAYDRQLDCPICSQRMETHPYYGPGNVMIDSCAACKFIWVDRGELAAIEQAPGLRQPPRTSQS